jgi:hypothetical protein
MIPIRDIIVKVPQSYKSSIKLNSGLEILLHGGLKQVKDTIRYGEVVALPDDCPYDICIGDTLFFHHGIVGVTVTEQLGDVESPYIIDREQRLFRVPINLGWHMCYAVERGGEFIALSGNCFVKPIVKKKIETFLEVPNNEVEVVGIAEMVYSCPELEAQGIKKGDKVAYEKDSEYTFYIGDKKYYRMFDSWITGKIIEN